MRELEDDWDAAAPPARPSPSDSPELELKGARPRQQAALASYRQPPRGSELPHQDAVEHQVDPRLSTLTLTLTQACGAPFGSNLHPNVDAPIPPCNLSTLAPLTLAPMPRSPSVCHHSTFTLTLTQP